MSVLVDLLIEDQRGQFIDDVGPLLGLAGANVAQPMGQIVQSAKALQVERFADALVASPLGAERLGAVAVDRQDRRHFLPAGFVGHDLDAGQAAGDEVGGPDLARHRLQGMPQRQQLVEVGPQEPLQVAARGQAVLPGIAVNIGPQPREALRVPLGQGILPQAQAAASRTAAGPP